MDTTTNRHRAVVGMLLFGLAIEALSFYPNATIFMVAVPLAMLAAMLCMDSLMV